MANNQYPQNNLQHHGRPKVVPKRLRNHLAIVCREVRWLVHFQEISWQFREIVKQSSVADTDSSFWEFVGWAHGGEIVHRIDRLCERQWPDRQRRVLSFVAFLNELKPYANLVNREYYIGIVPNTEAQYIKKNPGRPGRLPDTFIFHHANRYFDKCVGKTKFALSSDYIDRDIRRLKKITRTIWRYRNKHLAHLAADRKKYKPPSFVQVERAIELLRGLVNKYAVLVNNQSDDLEFGNVDITDIFMKPWISEDSQEPLVKQFDIYEKNQRKKSIRF